MRLYSLSMEDSIRAMVRLEWTTYFFQASVPVPMNDQPFKAFGGDGKVMPTSR